MNFFFAGIISLLGIFGVAISAAFFVLFRLFFKGAALFSAVRRVMPMQYAEILFVFIVVVVPIAFLIAFILPRRLVRPVVRRMVI